LTNTTNTKKSGMTYYNHSSLQNKRTPNIRFAAMLADSISISGKSLISSGPGGHYSIEHLLLTST